jgi:DNA-directed RNA polymerase subunit M/transcription elongation factor TFIIS
MSFKNLNIEHIEKYESHFATSVYDDLDFFDEFTKTLPKELAFELNSIVDRSESISKLMEHVMDIDICNKLEASVYESTLLYIYKNDLQHCFLYSVYNDKLNDMLTNLNKTSHIKNKQIINKLQTGSINPQEYSFLKPQLIHPENWNTEIEKKQKIEYAKNHRATTDMYKCKECGERKCIMYQMQIRSIDEPATNFATCLVCYNTARV